MPNTVSAKKHQDIREALEAGNSMRDISQMLNTSTQTILKVKREMGLPIRQMKTPRTRGPVRTVAQPSWDGRNYDVAEGYIEGLGSERPGGILQPEEYVAAFEARVLEYRTILAQKDSMIERLERELATVIDEYAQTVFRQQNWQGPTSIMNQSLGNGG